MARRRARAGLRVKLATEWCYKPVGTKATLGEKYRDDVGLLRINIRFDGWPNSPYTMSRPEVEETIVTLEGVSLIL